MSGGDSWLHRHFMLADSIKLLQSIHVTHTLTSPASTTALSLFLPEAPVLGSCQWVWGSVAKCIPIWAILQWCKGTHGLLQLRCKLRQSPELLQPMVEDRGTYEDRGNTSHSLRVWLCFNPKGVFSSIRRHTHILLLSYYAKSRSIAIVMWAVDELTVLSTVPSE